MTVLRDALRRTARAFRGIHPRPIVVFPVPTRAAAEATLAEIVDGLAFPDSEKVTFPKDATSIDFLLYGLPARIQITVPT